MLKFRALGVVLVAALVAGCATISIEGSGNVVSTSEEFTGFDRVSASHSFEVEIHQSESYGVVVRVDDNIVQHLQVVMRGSTLEIGLKPGNTYNINDATLEAEVSLPELTGLELSGSSDATVTGFASLKDLTVELSGSSSLEGEIDAGDVRIEASGSSDVKLSGLVRDLTVNASGSSEIQLADFVVDDADIEASGGSEVMVNAGGTLTVNASGGARVTYLGNPTQGSVETSGGASVERR